MNKDLTAEVLLTNEGQFDFAEVSNEVHDAPSKWCNVIQLGKDKVTITVDL